MAEKKISAGSTLKIESNKTFNSMLSLLNVYIPAYKDLSAYIDPTRGIFNGDRTKIGKMIDHKTLVDSHASFAKRTTSSGMQMGMTDQSRPWFKLTLEDILLTNVPGMREWVDEVTKRMLAVMNKSNIYKVFQQCYDEITQFGTGCFIILEDFEDVIRGKSFTAGEYMLATDNKGRVNRFAREFEMTIGQMAREFGYESLSESSKAFYNTNQMDVSIKIRHLIEPNNTRIPGYQDFSNMAYRSLYWEAGTNTGDEFLAKRGYKSFRVIAPRWDAPTTDTVLGYGPGWYAIGDIKELQATEKDALLAQQKLGDPPVIQDASVVGHLNKLPGGITKVDGAVPNSGVRPAYQVDPHLEAFQAKIENLHQKIDKHFFADIFRMISNLEGQPNITAFQIAQMKQEQMMMLGPILHSLNDEMHSRAIDIIAEIMLDAGLIPPPPQALPEGTELKVQFLSVLAQAQKLMGVQQIEMTLTSLGNLAQVYPGITDNVDVDEAAVEIMEGNSVPGKIIKSKEQIAAEREQRQTQQNQMIALQAGTQVADSAAKLAKAPGKGSGSVLNDLGNTLVRR